MLTPSDFVTYYRPSTCDLRVYLRNQGEPEPPAGPFVEVLRRLGIRHEQEHLRSLPEVMDLSGGSTDERIRRTIEAVKGGIAVIYQPAFRGNITLNGTTYPLRGSPDFLVKSSTGYRVRDCKISRRIDEKHHPEILLQLNAYGYLYESTFGVRPAVLEVLSGTSQLVEVPYEPARMLESFATIVAAKESSHEPYAAVGWTKCGSCSYRERCWAGAVRSRSVSLIVGVDQGLALALHDLGINTFDQLLETFDEVQLSELKRPYGARMQRVGNNAGKILRMARVMSTGNPMVTAVPNIPVADNYVMFDLEGLPPHLDELEKVYLWGIQAFGAQPGRFFGSVAGISVDGDRAGWEGFLAAASAVFAEYGDVPFVHWHHYEPTHVRMYITRFGDVAGTAARVLQNLVDLLPITQSAVALPLPSYSLKVVEEYVGYKRTLEEYGGDWAMAKYIEATETENEDTRKALIDEILAYNREDLEATWAVLTWLRGLEVTAAGSSHG